jgi:hypothetical protein
MHAEPATPAHLAEIRTAYADARALQAASRAFQWPEFTDRSIVDEMEGGRLFRVLDRNAFVGVFSVAYEDPAIWGELERGAHIYLHRFARAASYPGVGSSTRFWPGRSPAAKRSGVRGSASIPGEGTTR